jgi:D-alanyl-D-alanine carboxypeptidase/D-alanyl-D-alanine-endopeptidase (penicillin-binding protein 4)
MLQRRRIQKLLATGLLALAGTAQAQAPQLPAEVASLLARAKLPAEALAAVVLDTRQPAAPLLAWRAEALMNPASTLKLVTTYAALDRLGPDFRWQTRVYRDGTLRDGVLHGHLYLQGDGDPKLVSERLWLLLRRVQGLGIQRIAGDIVLDRSAFAIPEADPGAFDGEPLKPYNAAPDALLVNYRSQVFGFTPDPEAGVARLTLEPQLAGVELPASVPLETRPGAESCGDWRSALQADFSDALRPRFAGRYPASCGVREWPIAHPEPGRMAARAIAGMWQALGGQLDGQVRDGKLVPQARLLLGFESPPLAEVVRETNKFSNNVMAQQILLTLGRAGRDGAPAGWDEARLALERWWHERLGADSLPSGIGNGSGLSRDTRLSASALARLLLQAWQSGLMPDLAASLPVSGLDGTLRRSALDAGQAHLKTGSLRDVQALAGYVHGPDGQRRVLVAIVNHDNARAARPALDALVRWAAQR